LTSFVTSKPHSAAKTRSPKYFDLGTPAALAAILTALSAAIGEAFKALGSLGRRWLKLR